MHFEQQVIIYYVRKYAGLANKLHFNLDKLVLNLSSFSYYLVVIG